MKRRNNITREPEGEIETLVFVRILEQAGLFSQRCGCIFMTQAPEFGDFLRTSTACVASGHWLELFPGPFCSLISYQLMLVNSVVLGFRVVDL